MVNVIPGTKYYWQDFEVDSLIPRPGGALAPTRHRNLVDWLKKNVEPGTYRDSGHSVDEITFTFDNEEDAVAFKLRFGL